LRSIVVLDEHDESLQDERTPTWHARDVAIERASRAGVACVLVSPCPTANAVRWAGAGVVRPSATEAAAGWPFIEIVDRTDEEPWKRSLVSSALITQLRRTDARVVCVINTTGRARLVACRSCRSLQRCAKCDAAVSLDDRERLVCGRCGTERPKVCQSCGSSAMALVKPGVSRLREELEGAAARPVAAVTGESAELPDFDVFVGTEAVLHRVRGVDVVAFLDFDAELLAPRYRAGEQAMALLVRAARLVGPRRDGGRVLVQTFTPDHELLRAVQLGDPGRLVDEEMARRQMLGLPPFRALGVVEGADAEEFVRATGLEFALTAKGAMVRADTWMGLGAALAATPRPPGSRLRVEVDPPRV
jgi:primosomal protein N' (replication factor Y)